MKEYHVVLQPDQSDVEFYIDYKMAEKVFGAMIARLGQKGIPYNLAHVPQADHYLPSNLEKGSREHAIFLFMLCLWMRGGVESDTATIFLRKFHEEKPEYFNPLMYYDRENITIQGFVDSIKVELTHYRLSQRVEENSFGWVYNMRKLARHWDSDPRLIMSDKPSFEVLSKRIIGKTRGGNFDFINEDSPNGFMYFREKMASMIAYFLMDAKLVTLFVTPVPVDFHVLRLLTSNLIIRVRGKDVEQSVGIDFYHSETLRLAREVTQWYSKEYKVSPIALCDALWLLSRTLCRGNPGNSGYVYDERRKKIKRIQKKDKHSYLSEHLDVDSDSKESTVKGRKRYKGLRFNEYDLFHKSKIEKVRSTCGVCPVKDFCKYNISSGFYYIGGRLVPERLRFDPPNNQTDLMNHPAFSGSDKARIDPTVRFTEIYFS
jgi:hypothetical protein